MKKVGRVDTLRNASLPMLTVNDQNIYYGDVSCYLKKENRKLWKNGLVTNILV